MRLRPRFLSVGRDRTASFAQRLRRVPVRFPPTIFSCRKTRVRGLRCGLVCTEDLPGSNYGARKSGTFCGTIRLGTIGRGYSLGGKCATMVSRSENGLSRRRSCGTLSRSGKLFPYAGAFGAGSGTFSVVGGRLCGGHWLRKMRWRPRRGVRTQNVGSEMRFPVPQRIKGKDPLGGSFPC